MNSILNFLGTNKFWNISGAGMAHHNVRANVKASRSHSVMAHSGFGSMSIIIGDQKVVLPMSALKKDGCVKQSWKTAVNSQDTKALLSRGAVLA